jgi:hypothetical protein
LPSSTFELSQIVLSFPSSPWALAPTENSPLWKVLSQIALGECRFSPSYFVLSQVTLKPVPQMSTIRPLLGSFSQRSESQRTAEARTEAAAANAAVPLSVALSSPAVPSSLTASGCASFYYYFLSPGNSLSLVLDWFVSCVYFINLFLIRIKLFFLLIYSY